jgi:hypothetical protein
VTTKLGLPGWFPLRRRQAPLSLSPILGLLHEVIQIVMNWGGDHLHAFSVGSEHYGDPFNSLDLHDEESLRLSGAFTPSTKTITYHYDFGASWYHDITCEKVLDLEVGAIYPICTVSPVGATFPSSTTTMRTTTRNPSPSTKTKSTAACGR